MQNQSKLQERGQESQPFCGGHNLWQAWLHRDEPLHLEAVVAILAISLLVLAGLRSKQTGDKSKQTADRMNPHSLPLMPKK